VHRARDTSARCRTKTLATCSSIAKHFASLNRIRRHHRILAPADADVRCGVRFVVAQAGLTGDRGSFCVESTIFVIDTPHNSDYAGAASTYYDWYEPELEIEFEVWCLSLRPMCVGFHNNVLAVWAYMQLLATKSECKSMWLLMLMRRILYATGLQSSTRLVVVELQQNCIGTPMKVGFVSLAGGLMAWYVSLHRRQWMYQSNSERCLHGLGQRTYSLHRILCFEQAALDTSVDFAHMYIRGRWDV
jgi:hypothetical protein